MREVIIEGNQRLQDPLHLGAFVKVEIIEPAELSMIAGTGVLGVTRAMLAALFNECAVDFVSGNGFGARKSVQRSYE